MIGVPLVLGGILDNTFAFLTLAVCLFGFVGLFSRSFIVASFCGFLGFTTIALESEYSIFMTLLFVLIPAVLIMTSFQLYNMTQQRPQGGM